MARLSELKEWNASLAPICEGWEGEAELDLEPISDNNCVWAAERRVWEDLSAQVRTGLEALLETHLNETLAVALTPDQLEQYQATMGTEGLEDMVTQFLEDDETGIVLVELFVAKQAGKEIDVDGKVLGLYQQFAREFVEKLSLGYS